MCSPGTLWEACMLPTKKTGRVACEKIRLPEQARQRPEFPGRRCRVTGTAGRGGDPHSSRAEDRPRRPGRKPLGLVGPPRPGNGRRRDGLEAGSPPSFLAPPPRGRGHVTARPERTGISGKSQILFALVFTTRYLDLFTNFISIYNTVMKVVFLLCAYVTVYMIYGKFRKTFDIENDTFRLEFLLVPVIGLSFLENYSFTPLEILWTFSIYLESVAILPQLFMISKTGEAETITTHYLFFLGLYRALYLANWIRRYQTENFYDQIAVVSGVVQTIFYCDFFYLYVTKVLKGKKLSLPMPI
ncbi:PREDICTED: ER lumen protein retaining receptor 3 [Elephantulus edwardii]|nr:PREDICTED: ER lumen protein retaining receptor 3 [Elephantulus edwardii]